MFARVISLLLCFLALTPSSASAQRVEKLLPFHRLFSSNQPTGVDIFGEDPQISARMRSHGVVTAKYQIAEPHDSDKYSAGVSFLLMDSEGKRAIRVVFSDDKGEEKIAFGVQSISDHSKATEAQPEFLTFRRLSLGRSGIGQVSMRQDKSGLLTVVGDGRPFTVRPGFAIASVRVQIYCANAWVRFGDSDFTS